MRQTSVTTLRGTGRPSRGRNSDLGFNGFNFGSGGFGSDFGFTFGQSFSFDPSFSFGSGFDFQSSFPGLSFQGSSLNINQGFDVQQDFLGQLPTGLGDSQLPSLSQSDLPSGNAGDFGWSELVAYLIAQGPRYIEAWKRGQVPSTDDAPPKAKSGDPQKRMEALLRQLENKSPNGGGGGSGTLLGSVTPGQALGGAALAASLIAIVQTSQ